MRLFFLILLQAMVVMAYCQQKQNRLPVIILRTMPSSFIEADAGVSLGLGVQVAPRWAIQVDPMWVFYSPYNIANNEGERVNVHGYKLRTGITYFLRDYTYQRKLSMFFSAEWHYKNVSRREWETFGINATNGDYAYFQRAPYREVKIENGALVKTGFITPLGGRRWAMEVYAGIGVKFIKRRQQDIPAGGQFLSDPNADNIFSSEDGSVPMLPAGIRFLFRIF